MLIVVTSCSCETFFCANPNFNLLRGDIQSSKVDCSKGISLNIPPQKKKKKFYFCQLFNAFTYSAINYNK